MRDNRINVTVRTHPDFFAIGDSICQECKPPASRGGLRRCKKPGVSYRYVCSECGRPLCRARMVVKMRAPKGYYAKPKWVSRCCGVRVVRRPVGARQA
jgi:hypothetical protein